MRPTDFKQQSAYSESKAEMSTTVNDGNSGNWFRTMSVVERRTFWATLTGFTVNSMHLQLMAVAIPTLMSIWSLSGAQAGTLRTIALASSAIGGWLGGAVADRIGRAKTLRLSIVWFALATLLAGFSRSYLQLMVLGALQGFGFGAEWSAGSVLMGEVIAREKRGRAVGTIQGGWTLGYGSAVLLYTVLFSIIKPLLAWRLLFILSVVPAIFALWIARNVEEPELFQKMKQMANVTSGSSNMMQIFEPTVLRSTIVATLLAAGTLGGNQTILTWLPTYLNAVWKLSVLHTGGYLAVNLCGSFTGFLSGAYLSDRLGRRRTFVIMSVCAAVTLAVYTLAPLNKHAVLVLGFPLGFFQSGIVAGMGAAMAEMFPTRVRAAAQGFSFNMGRGVGAIAPSMVGLLTLSLSLAHAIGICAILSYGLVFIATAILPETRGKQLTAEV